MKLSTIASLALVTTPAVAQDFNIDIGPASSAVPSSSYAAAGLAGVWNAVVAPHTSPSTLPQPFDEFLVDLAGNPTNVRVHQFGGQAWIDVHDPDITGDDDALLGDAIVTHSLSLDTCLYINGLAPGTYEVLSYMLMPNHPEVVHKSKFDFVPGQQFTQGDWPGGHVEGVSFTRTIVTVTNGFMGPHAGIAAGGSAAIGGALNGMQIRRIECTSASFCSSGPNSTGGAALISSNGDCSVGANVFELHAAPVPNQFGIFFYGSTRAAGGAGVPFGNGLRCVGDGSQPLFRLPVTGASGNVLSHALDFGAPPSPAGAITPGSTWHFQAWFRDPLAGGASFDLSDGLTVSFH